MENKALIVIDIQNDITKHYRDVIDNINHSIKWAKSKNLHIIYMKHYNLPETLKTFKPNTKGSELVSELLIESNNIFTKTKANLLTSEECAAFLAHQKIEEVYITGADAVACVKASVFNLRKSQYKVNVITDAITTSAPKMMQDMLENYKKQGASLITTKDLD